MPSRAILVGDHVRVPWGLDILNGVVEDIYETGHGRRVVVRVAVPGASEDGETVTLPAEAIELGEGKESTSPGAWVRGAQYERKVHEALQRLLPILPGDAQVQSQARIAPDREADFLVQSGPRLALIEVKTGRPERKVTVEAISQLSSFLSALHSREAAGLLVTDLELTSSAQELLRTSPRLRAVRWRSPRDDSRLASALASLLGGNEE